MIYKHKKTGNEYEVISWNGKMKHPETREWFDAVVYCRYNDPFRDDIEIYTREKSDFIDKFELNPGVPL